MLAVGRKRAKDLHLPAGVREIAGRWYWQPTSKRERDERRAQGLSTSVTLGDAKTKAAREKWAEVSGFRDTQEEAGTVAELLHLWQREGIQKQPNGLPRADSTIELYKGAIPYVLEKFGAARYGKTDIDASRGLAIGPADIQRWISEHPHKAMANRYYAVLDNSFAFGISRGRMTYNPCQDVTKNAQRAREREPLPWEVECLRTLAGARLGLLMDFEEITGWRVSDILRLKRDRLTADGVRVRQKKKGKRQLWEWTAELRRIVTEAAALPGATPFPASPVFPTRRGGHVAYGTFNTQWQELKRKVNRLLAACEVPLEIQDLHFHDLRSKAHDDAEDAGMQGHEFLGNTEAVAHRHYRRREQKVRPLK